jgi:hypothetical protein
VIYAATAITSYITLDKPVFEKSGAIATECPATVNSFSISNANGGTTDSYNNDYATISFGVSWDDSTKISLTPSSANLVGQTFTFTIGATSS